MIFAALEVAIQYRGTLAFDDDDHPVDLFGAGYPVRSSVRAMVKTIILATGARLHLDTLWSRLVVQLQASGAKRSSGRILNLVAMAIESTMTSFTMDPDTRAQLVYSVAEPQRVVPSMYRALLHEAAAAAMPEARVLINKTNLGDFDPFPVRPSKESGILGHSPRKSG
jgi:hypothetical protein